jgi:hypothetical protein
MPGDIRPEVTLLNLLSEFDAAGLYCYFSTRPKPSQDVSTFGSAMILFASEDAVMIHTSVLRGENQAAAVDRCPHDWLVGHWEKVNSDSSGEVPSTSTGSEARRGPTAPT